jgi:hypothetical protein
MKKTVRAWSIVVEWEHEDGTWNTETITDIDNMTSNVVDEFLTELKKQKTRTETKIYVKKQKTARSMND